ncbi:MarR family winged helix-turn-helix transcriptional regulator [Streptomyces sp. NPDC002537]
MTADAHTHDVAALAAQPAAYWTWTTTQAILGFVQSELAHVDVSQPQWWALNHLHAAASGLTRADLRDCLDSGLYGFRPESMDHAVDSLLHRGWVTDTNGRLTLTGTGREAKDRTTALVQRIRGRIHEGIADEDYAAALIVLQRMVRNLTAEDPAPQ